MYLCRRDNAIKTEFWKKLLLYGTKYLSFMKVNKNIINKTANNDDSYKI